MLPFELCIKVLNNIIKDELGKVYSLKIMLRFIKLRVFSTVTSFGGLWSKNCNLYVFYVLRLDIFIFLFISLIGR